MRSTNQNGADGSDEHEQQPSARPRHHPAYCVPVELSQEREFEVEIQA